jgi:integrase
MIGSRPLSDQEVVAVLGSLKNARNRCLFLIGIKCGYRISEILSLTVENCTQHGKIKESITVTRANMKGKIRSRTVILHEDVKKALVEMGVLNMNATDRLFPIGRTQAFRIFKSVFNKEKLVGKVTTHSARKTFAKKIYHALKKDLIGTQKALGHASMNSTVSYLSFEQSEIDNAIKGT